MIRTSLLPLATLIVACSSPAPLPPPEEPVTPQTSAPVVEAPPKPPELSPEEKKKAEAQKELERDRAKWETEHKAEVARFTAELRAETKPYAETAYPNVRAALKVLLVGKHRQPGHAERDAWRHPLETLEFMGIKPNMTVLEVGPGEGWYTELLAPMLAKSGKLVVNTGDPNGPADQRSTFYAQRLKGFLDISPELYGKVERIVMGSDPNLGLEGKLDLALIIRGVHGMHNNKKLGLWLADIHKALKPNGVLGIVQHRAAEGGNLDEMSKKGYVPEKWLIAEVEAAGFKLEKKAEINANPKDTKDYPEGVWALPPTLERGEKGRDALKAIGESDRMTLKFVKVKAKPAPKEAPKADAPKAPAAPAAPAAPKDAPKTPAKP